MANRLLTVIVPAYNEERFIYKVLQRILAVDLIDNTEKEILVVDDNSTDGTAHQVQLFMERYPSANLRYVKHEINKGKGAAIRTGMQQASGDYMVIQDADLEYDPQEFNLLLAPIVNGFANVVYGSRFMGSGPHRVLFFWHTIGNKWLTMLSNMLTNLNLTDMETCYKLFKKEVIQHIEIKENRFGFEPEITAKVSRVPDVRIYEVGISYYGRTYAEGKKINYKDGFRAIACIIKYNLFSRK